MSLSRPSNVGGNEKIFFICYLFSFCALMVKADSTTIRLFWIVYVKSILDFMSMQCIKYYVRTMIRRFDGVNNEIWLRRSFRCWCGLCYIFCRERSKKNFGHDLVIHIFCYASLLIYLNIFNIGSLFKVVINVKVNAVLSFCIFYIT